jgi:hypothetical protein
MGPDKLTMSSNSSSKAYAIPKLTQDGSNWVTWKSHTLAVLALTRGVMRCVEGMARAPAPLPTHPPNHNYLAEEEEMLEKVEKRWDDYHQCEATIKAQVFSTIPDGILVEVQKLKTVKEVWDAVCLKHEGKGLVVNVDLCRQMQELKCEEDANVCTHLETMMQMHEELAGMGGAPDAQEFLTILLGLLPKTYRPLLTAITTAASIAKQTLTANDVSLWIMEEYDRRTIEARQLKANENALAVNPRGKSQCQGRSLGQNARSNNIECWGCGQLGHVKAECRSKGSDQRGKGRRGRNGKKGWESANTAADSDNRGGKDFAFTTTFTGAAMARESSPLAELQVEIYDTGASRHMSPYRHLFTNLTPMDPKPIKAANKTTFQAVAKGSMRITMPNGKGTATTMLKDVWYCPDLGFTLISIN